MRSQAEQTKRPCHHQRRQGPSLHSWTYQPAILVMTRRLQSFSVEKSLNANPTLNGFDLYRLGSLLALLDIKSNALALV
jgi:hypothetical protein